MSKGMKNEAVWFTIAVLALMVGILIKGAYDEVRNQRALDEGKVDTINSHCAKYVEFDGHQYVQYISGNHGSLCHSPKCPCFNAKEGVE